MAFGNPKKYVQLNIPQTDAHRYREALREANQTYSNLAVRE